jgi:hypothetical protein
MAKRAGTMPYKTIGPRTQGDWYCMIDGVRHPVGHSFNTDEDDEGKGQYFDPSDGWVSKEWKTWIEAVIKSGLMVIQISKRGPEMGRNGKLQVHCVGYLGLYKATDIEFRKKDKVFMCRIEKIADVGH